MFATIRGVLLLLSLLRLLLLLVALLCWPITESARAFTSAPFSSKQLKTSACPLAAATNKAVQPLYELQSLSETSSSPEPSMSALYLRSIFTQSRLLFWAATINGVDLINDLVDSSYLPFLVKWTVFVSNAEALSLAFNCWRTSWSTTESPDLADSKTSFVGFFLFILQSNREGTSSFAMPKDKINIKNEMFAR